MLRGELNWLHSSFFEGPIEKLHAEQLADITICLKRRLIEE